MSKDFWVQFNGQHMQTLQAKRQSSVFSNITEFAMFSLELIHVKALILDWLFVYEWK